ncbi:MAG: phosphomannomutase/phosphoglucomutase [Gammaproteobacteria bacterium]|nr:phosphomannomutase/phosphoglucomutase [Gammaproteobacteria bacterium]
MVDGPVSGRRFSRRQIRNALMIGGGAMAALVVVIGGWAFYNSSSESALESTQQQLQELANQQAQQISLPFVELDKQLRKLSQEPAVIALFIDGGEDKLGQAADSRLSQIDSALKLRFILPGLNELDKESSPPLGYGSLDLLRRAETTSAQINAEAHFYGSSNEHIVMLQRVKNEAEETIGAIHLSLNIDVISKATAGLSIDNVYLELRQGSGGKALVLSKQGNAALRVGEPISASVKGARWTVDVWSSTDDLPTAESGSGLEFIAPLLVVVLLLGVGVVIFLKRPGGSKKTKSSAKVIYAGAVKAIMDGAHPGMEKMVPNLPAVDGDITQESLILKDTPEVGDDITMMIKSEDMKAAAAESEVFDLTQAEPAESPAPEAAPVAAPTASATTEISAEIFRAYDIRGVVGETITAEIITKIGQAIGSEAGHHGQAKLVVGRDGRNSSPELAEALIQGLQDSGRYVVDIGVVPTPLLYFATHFLEIHSGVMLTGSHNGPEYNGLKIVIDGKTLAEDGIQSIYKRVKENDYESGHGTLETNDVVADYIRRISEDIPVALGGALKIVVDCGNGVAGAVAPQLIRALGHDVVELYCDVDGNFPNHHPDPSQPENLQVLISKIKEEQADLGLAFDGDGDRLGVVDDQGNIIWPDRQLMLLAKDVLSRNQGATIIYDVKCSRHLKTIIESSGGVPLMWKTGHSLIKAKMKEVDAPLAGEMSGHIFFKERWYGFDDAIYTAARLLEVLMAAKVKPSETFAGLPEDVSTPELRIDMAEAEHQSFMTELQNRLSFEGAEVVDIDGYRVEFADGWGLIRPSNTTPCLVLRFEADNQAALERIQGEFRNVLLSINSDLQLPF